MSVYNPGIAVVTRLYMYNSLVGVVYSRAMYRAGYTYPGYPGGYSRKDIPTQGTQEAIAGRE